jgi:hypothetical protein
VTFKREDFEEVDEEVLSGGPAVSSSVRQSNCDSNRVVEQGLDASSGDLATIPSEKESETDDDRGEVDRSGREDVMPASRGRVSVERTERRRVIERRTKK